MTDIVLQICLVLLSLVGVAITAIGFPGIFLILVSLVIYGVLNDFSYPSTWVYITFAVISILSTFADNVAVLVGAKKFGSSPKAVAAAFLGGIVGFFTFPPIGMLIGAFIGAFIADFMLKRDIQKAFKGALGTLVGYVGGIFVKLMLALVLFFWLLFIIFFGV